MNHCIYTNKSEPHLTFSKREHVIPAALGGINTLPLGSVSNEINESFSKIERVALQHSFLSINRGNFGPGKRGSLNIKKVKNPNVMVVKEGENSHEVFRLGFIFAGETYLIPQIYLDFNDEENSISPTYFATILDGQVGVDIINKFKGILIDFLKNRSREFLLIELPFSTQKHFICIGCYNGKWFAATSHKYINMDYLAYELLPSLEKEKEKPALLQPQTLFNYQRTLQLDSSFPFIYVKTGFNSLAYLMGIDFVLDSKFDTVRNAIKDINELDTFILERRELYNLIKGFVANVPDKSHFVILTTVESMLISFVSFYKEPPAIIKLAGAYKKGFPSKAIICDWKNRNEYIIENIDDK
jgi:hypothetical protein